MKRKWMFFAPPLFLAFLALMGWVVMSLWNYVLVPTLQIGALSYWQGVGLLILTRILFGGFGRGGGWKSRGGGWKSRGGPSPQFKQKWMNMSDEEKLKFKEDWKKRCGPKE